MSEFSNRLVSLREKHGWSKTYVAKLIGVSMPTYANYEYGRREPSYDTISRIANLYSVSVDYLLGRGRDGNSTKDSSKKPTADLAYDDTIFTYEGREIPPEDLEYMRRLLLGGQDRNKDK